MFLKSIEVKPIVDAIFYSVKARGVESIRVDYPCISPIEIRDKFLKGNIRLISDTWYPIVNTVPADFLLENPIWGQRFLDATCTVLSSVLTYFFHNEKVEEKIWFEIGKCPIAPDIMTACICKADADLPVDFPPVNKLSDWKTRKYPMTPYGELKFINIVRDRAMTLFDNEVDRELADPESGFVMPKPGEGDYRELLNIDNTFNQAGWVVDSMCTKSTMARGLESAARKVAVHLEEGCERTERELQEHMDGLKGPIDNIQRRFLTKSF